MEVGGREPRLRVALDLLVEAGIPVGVVLEGDVELRVQGEVELGRLGRVGAHRGVGRILVDDVVLRAEAAHVVREDHVRGEGVAKRDPLLRERGPERDGVRLLDVSPEVRLDVDDDRLRPPYPLEHQSHVLPVRLHQLCVAQVREIRLRLVAAVRVRLQEHVVGEHRNHAVRPGVADVHRRERAAGVPRRPALPRVHASREVLVADAERRRLAKRRRAARRIGEPELKRLRPAVRERRQLGGGGRGEGEKCEQYGGDAHALETPEHAQTYDCSCRCSAARRRMSRSARWSSSESAVIAAGGSLMRS